MRRQGGTWQAWGKNHPFRLLRNFQTRILCLWSCWRGFLRLIPKTGQLLKRFFQLLILTNHLKSASFSGFFFFFSLFKNRVSCICLVYWTVPLNSFCPNTCIRLLPIHILRDWQKWKGSLHVSPSRRWNLSSREERLLKRISESWFPERSLNTILSCSKITWAVLIKPVLSTQGLNILCLHSWASIVSLCHTQSLTFVYILLCSAVDQFRRQFAHLEENSGKTSPVAPLERKHASLPR